MNGDEEEIRRERFEGKVKCELDIRRFWSLFQEGEGEQEMSEFDKEEAEAINIF